MSGTTLACAPTAMNVAPAVARFVTQSRLEGIAEPVGDEAVRALVDWLGCCLGGCLQPGVDAIGATRDDAPDGGEATLPGRGDRGGLGLTAMRSAVASDALDYAAIHAPSGAAVSVPIVAALLPLAQARAAAGADVIHAFVLGAELTCRLAQALSDAGRFDDRRAYAACGRIGAVVACGKLLGLDAARLEHAITVTASADTATGQAEGGDRDELACSARRALTVALHAERAPIHCFESPAGEPCLSERLEEPQHAAALLQGLGEEWHLARIAYKPYPCDNALHAVIEAGLRVRALHRPLARHVAQIELHVHPSVLVCAYTQIPSTAAQARRSLEHALAVALLDGTAGIEQFTDRRVASTRVAQLRLRIELRADERLPAAGAHVLLRTLDGRVLEHGVRCARGNPSRPLSDSELSDKFRELAAEVIATDQAERLLALTWNVRSLADIGALVRASVPDEAPDPAELPGSPLLAR